MPTIAEPNEPARIIPLGGTVLGVEMLDAILLEFSERGITPTPLAVLSHCLDVGIPEAVAVRLAGLVDSEEVAHAA